MTPIDLSKLDFSGPEVRVQSGHCAVCSRPARPGADVCTHCGPVVFR